MKVLLDPQIFISQKFGGISRLFVEVWKNSVSNNEIDIKCPLIYSENYHLNESGLEPKNMFTVLHKFNFKGSGRIKDFLKSFSIKKAKKNLKAQQFDVFLSTYYDPYFLDHLNDKPFVLTVYDMIHEIFPEHFSLDTKTIPQKKLLIEKADKIIAISKQTKKDLLKFYPNISPAKVDIVYLSQTIIDNGTSIAGQLPSNFILFVGNRGGYKNFRLLAETAVPFLKKDQSLHIVCAGGGKLSGQEIKMLEGLGIRNNVMQREYKDSELASIYKAAKMFVFPSAYEGFGIPTLEAMKCGCPVILADSSCMPEIGSEAAMYFESDNASSLENAIDRMLKDESLRKEFVQKGFKRANEFSWENTAKGYFKVIKELA
jgi:glycosyltransferase involved in cell wall biosynthesis